MRLLKLAWIAAILALPGVSLAADGAHPNPTCVNDHGAAITVLDVKANESRGVSYCPVSTTTQLLRVQSHADCNWNADTTSSTAGIVAGQATLTATKCSGTATAASDCKNVLTDSNSNTTITSGDPTGSFTLASGTWLITASGAATNGRLVCTGRQ